MSCIVSIFAIAYLAKEQEFNNLGVFRRGARLYAPSYEQFVGFI